VRCSGAGWPPGRSRSGASRSWCRGSGPWPVSDERARRVRAATGWRRFRWRDCQELRGRVGAAGHGKPRNEGDSLGFAVLEDVVVGAVGQVVAVLDADDVDLAAGRLQLVDGDFGQAEVADLAFGLELGESAELVLERDGRVDAVQLQEPRRSTRSRRSERPAAWRRYSGRNYGRISMCSRTRGRIRWGRWPTLGCRGGCGGARRRVAAGGCHGVVRRSGGLGSRCLVEQLQAYWEVALAPYWRRIRALLEGDLLYRARRLGQGGPVGLFEVQLDVPRRRLGCGADWVDCGWGFTASSGVAGCGVGDGASGGRVVLYARTSAAEGLGGR
jgi:hypothetical protein